MMDEVERVRAMSQAAFGQKYRLEVMCAFSESSDGLLCLSDLAARIGTVGSNLQKPLASLVATGLISPLESGDSKRKFYLRNRSAAWAWAKELVTLAEVGSYEIV